MSQPRYKLGDVVALRSSPFRRLTQTVDARVSSVRVDNQRNSEYRVRLAGEVFERYVTDAEIDHAASQACNLDLAEAVNGELPVAGPSPSALGTSRRRD
ncbi:hypothetical protein [Pseudorhizobium flavum]|uniref:Uncharacterized protein n=1 Tax=Pseudorhizobium flavum TaxID=1335061 RepID=A0A7W9YU59_9HYPH|nr:hypothetical protein [Pseudorhizobium flavum]MBB6178079.1 hypothetical protein [Pseudorhizobium flavum]CAD6615037.1 cold-shock protein [Pseudorhizobium flavum]